MVSLFSLSMAGVRAWVRRGFAADPLWVPLPDDIELYKVVQLIKRIDWDKFKEEEGPQAERSEWEILTGTLVKNEPPDEQKATRASRRPKPEEGSLLHKVLEYPQRLEKYALDTSDINALQSETSKQKNFVLGFPSDKRIQQCPEAELLEDLLRAHGKSMSELPLGKCWEVAKMLAIALKGVMATIEKNNNRGFSWERNLTPWVARWEEYHGTHAMPDEALAEEEIGESGWPDWQIDVQRESAVKGTWIVRKLSEDDPTDPDLLARKLCAGLYLWITSFKCGDELFGELFGEPYRFSQLETNLSFYLQESRVTQGKKLFTRILGDVDAPTTANKQMTQMASWIQARPHSLVTVPAYNGKETPYHSSTSPWPVFGLYYSAAFK